MTRVALKSYIELFEPSESFDVLKHYFQELGKEENVRL